MRILAVAVAFVFTVASSLVAQDEIGPKAGTWGAEAGTLPYLSASLLRFRSPTSAWLFGATSHLQIYQITDASAPQGVRENISFVTDVRVGLRFYGDAKQRARPLMTMSGLLGYYDGQFGRGYSAGGVAEAGGAYFFNDHLSVGASGEITVVARRTHGSVDEHMVSADFGGFRLLAAMYF